MAHAIIFTDRAPRAWSFAGGNFDEAYFTPAAGAYKIASVLREKGLKVIVVPNCLSLTLQGVKKIIEQNKKDLLWVGVSTTFLGTKLKEEAIKNYRITWRELNSDTLNIGILFNPVQSYKPSTEMVWSDGELNLLSDYLKNQNVPLILGGPWASFLTNVNDNIYIVEGSAEEFIEKFTLEKLNDFSIKPIPFRNITYDDVGFKTSSILWKPEDCIDSETWLPIEVARGCAFACAYCSYDRRGNFDSYKDPKVLRKELIRNYEMFGSTKYVILDDLYNDTKDKVRVLYDEVWSKLPFKPEWASYMRLDMIYADNESAEILKASGAKLGSFGIETLHDRAGKKVGKGLGKERTIETLNFLKEKWGNDVLVHAFFIAGLPHEPKESIQNTIEWLGKTDLIDSYQWAPLWITPPSHMELIKTKHAISIDNDKYGIKWLSDKNWINETGLTFDEADNLASQAMKLQSNGLSVSFGGYADLRTSGFSHQELAQRKNDQFMSQKLLSNANTIKYKIMERLQKIFQIHD